MIEDVYTKLKKKYGEKINMGSSLPDRVERIPTGCLALDMALGGGIPRERITTISGVESTAKTATAYNVVYQAQKLFPDRKVGWVSPEPLDKGWAQVNNVDLSNVYIAEPQVGEEVVDALEAFISTGDLSVVVLDSIGALMPRAELEGSSDDSAFLLRAKLVKRMMGKINSRLQPSMEKRNTTAVVLLNHLYQKPDQYDPWATAGGQAVRMFSSLMLRFFKSDYVYEEEIDATNRSKRNEMDRLGINVNVKFEKDKIQGTQKPFEFRYFNKSGIIKTKSGREREVTAGTFDNITSLIELGQEYPSLENPLIKKGGTWYSVEDLKVQGADALAYELSKRPELYNVLEERLREIIQ